MQIKLFINLIEIWFKKSKIKFPLSTFFSELVGESRSQSGLAQYFARTIIICGALCCNLHCNLFDDFKGNRQRKPKQNQTAN